MKPATLAFLSESSGIGWIELGSVLVGAILGVVATMANARRSVWLRSLLSLIRGIEAVRAFRRDDGRIEIDEDELIRILSSIQDRDQTRGEVRKARKRMEGGDS